MNEMRTRAAAILQRHFDTEASDAGLKSLNLENTGASGSRSFDAAAVARADRRLSGATSNHTRVRETLATLSAQHRDVLTLAYGIRLRDRDIEDGKKRKALRQTERNWRVRLAEIYGPGGAYVLASPMAKKLFERHVQSLAPLSTNGNAASVQVRADESESAEDVFARARAHVHSPDVANALQAAAVAQTSGFVAWLLDAGRTHSSAIQADANKLLNAALDAFAERYKLAREPRRRSDASKARILASHGDNGYEVG